MLCQICSTNLASTFRNTVLSLANTCSMGLRWLRCKLSGLPSSSRPPLADETWRALLYEPKGGSLGQCIHGGLLRQHEDELDDGNVFETQQVAKNVMFFFIEGFYNR